MTRHIEAKLARKLAEANDAFQLIEPNDRIMVCVSGGKDSWAMLHLLERARRVAPIPFTIFAFHLQQGHPGFPVHLIREHLEEHSFEYVIHAQDTYSIVKEKLSPGQTTCSLCSRLRRGIIYNQAQELGATKIALGHHRDDLIETLLLNVFFSGQLKAMPPKLFSDDRRNTVIRPLAFCPEEWIIEYSRERKFPIIPCTLCSTQDNLQRNAMGRLLDDLSKVNPNVRGNAFHALRKIVPTHLLDRSIYDPNEDGARAPATLEELQDALSV